MGSQSDARYSCGQDLCGAIPFSLRHSRSLKIPSRCCHCGCGKYRHKTVTTKKKIPSQFPQSNKPFSVGVGKSDIHAAPLVEQVIVVFPQKPGGGVGRRISVSDSRQQVGHSADPFRLTLRKSNYLPKKRMGFGQHGVAVYRQVTAHLSNQPFALSQCSFHRVRPPLRLMLVIVSLAFLCLPSE